MALSHSNLLETAMGTLLIGVSDEEERGEELMCKTCEERFSKEELR
jgi:hypothetical protein